MSFDISNYTTVNERILTFYDRYPSGIISTHPAKTVELGSSTFISVMAEVYTAPDSAAVCAEAWEPYPGKTPYTRDSEMMNAATSAIGRALMQLGIGIDKSGASAEEVQARKTDGPALPPPTRTGVGKWKATPKQIAAVNRMMGTIPHERRGDLLEHLTGIREVADLTGDHIDQLFKLGNVGIQDGWAQIKDAQAAADRDAEDDDPWAVEKW